MVKYTHLNRDPGKAMEDLVKKLNASAKGQKTKPSGIKDMGESGDIVWPRPDGTPVSVRDVDLELEDARQRIEDAEGTLAENGSRLTVAEQAVQDVRDELAAIEVGEGGPLIHSTPPGPADGEGKPAGTAWLVYGTDGALTSVWQWDGTVWEEMPLDATLIPVLDIGSGTFGDLEGARLVVDDTLSARVVQAMSAEVKKLVVTEEAVLNHATLIGQTVVDDINVQGKLVGKDGVFTGTVDFENVNVTDEVLAARISGEYIYGTVIEGGQIRTSDALPGQVVLADDGYETHFGGGQVWPGLRVIPADTTGFEYMPGIGPSTHGLTIYGGKQVDVGSSIVQSNPDGSIMRTFRADGIEGGEIQTSASESFMRTYQADGTVGGEIQTSASASYMRTTRADGTAGGVMQTSPTDSRMRTYSGDSWECGLIQALPQSVQLAYVAPDNAYFSRVKADATEAFLYTRAGGSSRYLSVDANGVWVKRQRSDGSGGWDSFNLLGDDWGTVTLGSEWSPRTSGGYYGGLRVRRLGGSVEINGAVQGGSSGSKIGTIADPRLRPKYDTFVVTTLAAGGLGQAFVGANGDIMHSYGPSRPAFLAINVSIPLN